MQGLWEKQVRALQQDPIHDDSMNQRQAELCICLQACSMFFPLSCTHSEMGLSPSHAAAAVANPSLGMSSTQQSEDELELVYDPDLNCFYDPNTEKCYELAH